MRLFRTGTSFWVISHTRIDIHAHVIVDQHVSQSGDTTPRDIGMPRAELLG
jgi:hypothetical protein